MPEDSTIGGLAAASTLGGTEVLPVEQGGVTVKATVDQIVAAGNGTYVPVAGTYVAGQDMFTARRAGDTNPRFAVNENGTLQWGSGSAAPDTYLFRDAGALVAPVNFTATAFTCRTAVTLNGESGAAYIDIIEGGLPAAPAANWGRLFSRDNGAGKTQICVRFATGAEQVIATEP